MWVHFLSMVIAKSFYNVSCSNWQKTHFVIRIGFESQNADVDESKAGLDFEKGVLFL